MIRTGRSIGIWAGVGICLLGLTLAGCRSPEQHRRKADDVAGRIIDQKQQQALGRTEPLEIERPADTLRRRLLLDQDLPLSHPASLGTSELEPPPHWPEGATPHSDVITPDDEPHPLLGQVLHLTLVDALQIGAANSREYQSRKETVFIEALNLDLERNAFRTQFRALFEGRAMADLAGDDTVAGVGGTASAGADHLLTTGAAISTRIGIDLIRLLTLDRQSSYGLFADASIAVPLLRGAGRHIVMEPLTQAERNVVYAIWDFETFKRTYAVNVATSYMSVLQQLDQVQNAEENYRRLVLSSRRSGRLFDAGRLPQIQVDQAVQQELRARDRWISSQQGYARQLDNFKMLLGLPPDASVELDREELARLVVVAERVLDAAPPLIDDVIDPQAPPVPPEAEPAPVYPGERPPRESPPPPPADEPFPAADDPVELAEPSLEDGGPYEMETERAIHLALANRLDLFVRHGQVFDAQRRVVVAADALRAGLTLTGSATAGGRRTTLGAAAAPDAQLRFDEGFYNAGLLLDLPVERTAQRNAYRISLISLERATRSVQEFEDQIKLTVRNSLRNLLQAREGLQIQALAIQVAERRVRSANMFLEAGRAQIRDLLEAEESLVTAQNAFTAALVNYRIGELELQRDLGVLEVNHEGLWREYAPEELTNE